MVSSYQNRSPEDFKLFVKDRAEENRKFKDMGSFGIEHQQASSSLNVGKNRESIDSAS